MDTKKTLGAIAATAVLGLTATSTALANHTGDKPFCKNASCKGKSACHGHGNKNGCKGQNTCKGKGWLDRNTKADCEAEKDGVKGKWVKLAKKPAAKQPAPKK